MAAEIVFIVRISVVILCIGAFHVKDSGYEIAIAIKVMI